MDQINKKQLNKLVRSHIVDVLNEISQKQMGKPVVPVDGRATKARNRLQRIHALAKWAIEHGAEDELFKNEKK